MSAASSRDALCALRVLRKSEAGEHIGIARLRRRAVRGARAANAPAVRPLAARGLRGALRVGYTHDAAAVGLVALRALVRAHAIVVRSATEADPSLLIAPGDPRRTRRRRGRGALEQAASCHRLAKPNEAAIRRDDAA